MVRPERRNTIGPYPRAHLGCIHGASEAWKPGRRAEEPKSSSAPCDHLTKVLVFARDPVDSQEGALTCCLRQKAQYSEFVGWETPCECWQAEAQCFGIAFIFYTQILNAAMISPETKMFPKLMLGSSSAPTELGAHSLDTAPEAKKRTLVGAMQPRVPGEAPLLHQGTSATERGPLPSRKQPTLPAGGL